MTIESLDDCWSETIFPCFRKVKFVIHSIQNDKELFGQLGDNELQSLMNDLRCVPNHDNINEADYV